MRQGHLFLGLSLILCSHVTAAPANPFSATDVFELEWVSDPQIAPDGEQVVYVRNGMDVMSDQRQRRLWLINHDGSGHRPLTGRDVNESAPRWSPDGQRIVFVSAGEHGSEIFLYWRDSGIVSRLSQLERSPRNLSWSPDGTAIAFSMLVPEKPPIIVPSPSKPKGAKWAEKPRVTTRLKYESDGSGYVEPGFNHLFVIPADGGTPQQVTDGDYHHNSRPQWSPDGRHLYFSANRSDDWEYDFRNSEIYSLDLDEGTIKALTDRKGPDRGAVVSPDGRQIAYAGYADKVQTYQVSQLQIMQADGSDQQVLSGELDRSVSDLSWDRRGRRVYFRYSDHGDGKIAYVTRNGDVTTVVGQLGGTSIGRPYGGGSFSLSRSGRIAYTHSSGQSPASLALVSANGGEPQVIVDLNQDLLPSRKLGAIEEINYPSSVDGRDIQAWIVTPPGFDPAQRPYPLLVEIHGGPISAYGPHFSPEIQLYAAAGYVVFYPNPRGSTGYGEEFGNLLYHDYPGDDYQDIMDGVDVLIQRGLVASDQLFVTGGSAGGIMTAWIIGKNKRFKAAAVVKPVMNWFSKTLTADNYYSYAHYRFPGQPWENIETYMKYSPVSLVGNITTPTLVMVGTADLRTPLSEAKQLYNALKLRRIDTALVEIPGAPHFIARRPSQLVAKINHVLAWFDRYRTVTETTIEK